MTSQVEASDRLLRMAAPVLGLLRAGQFTIEVTKAAPPASGDGHSVPAEITSLVAARGPHRHERLSSIDPS